MHLRKANIIYFSHGGGPLPLLGDQGHQAMIQFMKDLPAQLPVPEAVIVLSAHWEEPVPTVTGGTAPELFYDYYGFPAETYRIKYPAPGSPETAALVGKLLHDAGIESAVDHSRGFDHGLFVPMLMMYPDADIPVIQLSLVKGLDPDAHIRLGRALRPLLDRNVLIIGSGFSFHNMGVFMRGGGNRPDAENDAFQDWLIECCTATPAEDEMLNRLSSWADAPSARYCHPREEHLLPLHVCAAAAGTPAQLIFDDYIIGQRAVAFRWQ